MSRRTRRSVAALVAMLCTLLLASGCGGKSEKEKFADQVNDICTDLEHALEQIEGTNSYQEIGREGKQLIPAVDRAGKRLANVEATAEVKRELGADYTEFVAIFRATAIAYVALVGAAEKNDQRRVQTLLGQLDVLDQQSNRQAEKLGFDDCAGG